MTRTPKITAVAARAAAAVAVSLALACQPAPPPEAPAGPAAGKDGVLAVVNGHVIRDEDVRLALGRSGVEDPTPVQKRNVVETLIKKELIAQEAERLGLADSPKYLDKLHKAQAEVDAVRRKDLGDLYQAKEVVAKAAITDEEAKAWFDAHQAELGQEYHVKQILRRDRQEVEEMKAQLDGGATFDDVAGKRYEGKATFEKAPWDLGWMRWSQMPAPWRGVVDQLPDGGVSAVIEGEGNRYWLVNLVEKRAHEASFAEEAEPIKERLQSEKAEARQSELATELRSKASVSLAPEIAAAKQ